MRLRWAFWGHATILAAVAVVFAAGGAWAAAAVTAYCAAWPAAYPSAVTAAYRSGVAHGKLEALAAFAKRKHGA
jgi:hypothetical protein